MQASKKETKLLTRTPTLTLFNAVSGRKARDQALRRRPRPRGLLCTQGVYVYVDVLGCAREHDAAGSTPEVTLALPPLVRSNGAVKRARRESPRHHSEKVTLAEKVVVQVR